MKKFALGPSFSPPYWLIHLVAVVIFVSWFSIYEYGYKASIISRGRTQVEKCHDMKKLTQNAGKLQSESKELERQIKSHLDSSRTLIDGETTEIEDGNYIQEVTKSAEECGLTVDSYFDAKPQKFANCSTISITLNLTGQYHQFCQFVDAISNGSRQARIPTLRLTRNKFHALSGQMVVEAYSDFSVPSNSKAIAKRD